MAKSGGETVLAGKFRLMKKTVCILGPELDLVILVYPRVRSAFFPAWCMKCLATGETGQSVFFFFFFNFIIPLARLGWNVGRDMC